MKELKVLIFTLLIIGMLIMSNKLEAQNIYFDYPNEGQTFYCLPGNTTANVDLQWSYSLHDDHDYHGCELMLDNDGYWRNVGYNTNRSEYFSTGPHTAIIRLWEEIHGTIYYLSDTRHFTVNPATHGTTSSVNVQLGPGFKNDEQTSSFISPGSNVAWALRIWGYNSSSTIPVVANAGILFITNIAKEIYHSDGYFSLNQNGTISAFRGGTLECFTIVVVGNGGSGNAGASATITW